MPTSICTSAHMRTHLHSSCVLVSNHLISYQDNPCLYPCDDSEGEGVARVLYGLPFRPFGGRWRRGGGRGGRRRYVKPTRHRCAVNEVRETPHRSTRYMHPSLLRPPAFVLGSWIALHSPDRQSETQGRQRGADRRRRTNHSIYPSDRRSHTPTGRRSCLPRPS